MFLKAEKSQIKKSCLDDSLQRSVFPKTKGEIKGNNRNLSIAQFYGFKSEVMSQVSNDSFAFLLYVTWTQELVPDTGMCPAWLHSVSS